MKRLASGLPFALASLIGLVAFVYPLLLPEMIQQAGGAAENAAARAADAPLVGGALVALCVVTLLVETAGQAISAKTVATLGILIAMIAALRLLETAIPGPGGFTPVFAPLILCGYVFGARFGFLLGALGLLASALVTGGVGPWLPYQMFAAGWMGLTAAWLPRPADERLQVGLLALFGVLWGFLFGAIMNLYFWPFLAGDAAVTWASQAPLAENLARYGAFYLATSLAWDAFGALGNVALILALGAPALKVLGRFRDRLSFQVVLVGP